MSEARRQEALRAARRLLEDHDWDAVTMRRIADTLGIRAPSLYKHLADKQELQAELTAIGLRELGDALHDAGPSLSALARAYRSYALAHPHLYELMTTRPLPRDRLPAGLEDAVADALRAVLPDEHRARAAWASAHGLTLLELAGRFPPGADLDAAWAALTAAFSSGSSPS